MNIRRCMLVGFGFCLAYFLAACSPVSPQKIDLQPCSLGNISAQCGTLQVFENLAAKQGRKIDIHVAVIKARGANPAPDPIFYLAGGPGSSAIEDAPYVLRVLNTASQQRDIVLVDQRGTGQSNEMNCPRSAEEASGLAPMDEAMLSDLEACMSGFEADLSAYTTAWGMDDLDDVRAALGYDKINLYGESYGPTAGQVYLARHGKNVRTLTMEGVTLLDVPIFEKTPRSSQQALDLLFARCQADPECGAAYPNLPAETSELLARLEKQPVELPLMNPRTGTPVFVDRDILVIGIHNTLIYTEKAVLLPYLIHQAYLGNWAPVAQATASSFSAGAPAPQWHMMNLTILCHEDWAKLRPDETKKYGVGSYLNYEDVRNIIAPESVCDLVARPQPAALYQPPAKSNVPVLIISNQADPQDPPENVAGASDLYPNSLSLIAPGQGHGYTGIGCRDQIIASFIEQGSVKSINADCLQQVPLPAFYHE